MAERRVSAQQREAIAERASWCCEYCYSQAAFSPDPFSTEHVVPRSRGGTNELSNLGFSCQGCNNYKHTRTEAPDPLSGEIAPLYHPRHGRWDEHFVWSDDSSEVIGLTPTGRVTIVLLKLNRPGVVNLRRVLKTLGEHPPPGRPRP